MGLRLWGVAATIVCSAVLISSVKAEQCKAPGFAQLRDRLIAQNTKNIARVESTGNCALIPGVLAFNRKANQAIKDFIAGTRGQCSVEEAQLSTDALEQQLR